MKAAVLSFFNTVSGQYRWWDEFPAMIGEGLARSGIAHEVFRRDYNELAADPPEARHPTPDRALADPNWIRAHVRPVAARYDKVIFHTHGHYQPIWLGPETRHHGRARWFWTEHRISEPRRLDWLRKSMRIAGQKVRLLPHRLYGVSQAGAARLQRQFSAASVRCIRTGVRLLEVPPRRPLPAGARPHKGLFVGRLIEEKGFWILLRAAKLLRDRNVDITLTIVGPGDLPAIQSFVDANGLHDRVRLAGYQKDTRPFYEEADFLVVPTLVAEALGMVSLEARMYGVPVIYSRRGGLPETQIEGVTGLPLAALTPEDIAAKIEALISHRPAYDEMSRQAPRGLQEFSQQHMIDAYVRDYVEAFERL